MPALGSTFGPLLRTISKLVVLLAIVGMCQPAAAQIKLDAPPINYWETAPNDAIAKLQKRLDGGDAKLDFEPHFGYLRGLLKQLQVPVSSQGLVFSKTSLQVKFISPRSPRAIYFNDDVYVGWVPGGHIEISAVDPQLAANFYSLLQQDLARPKIVRQHYECLQCHASVMTRDVPGHVVRSVPAGPDGHVIASGKSFLSDHNSPLQERWGGWYVTGEHGNQRHLGNLFFKPSQDVLDLEPGANVTDLSRWFDTSKHLSVHSDIVVLMVLEHQVNMHNRIARAGFLVKAALHDEAVVKKDQSESIVEREQDTAFAIRQAAEPVVEHLLFANEIPLTAKIVGKSGFAEEFGQRGPRDGRGRSLRDLDLQTRLFKYPCSYVIYSAAFDQLPRELKDEIYRQLWRALQAPAKEDRFRQLSAADRQAIVEIVRATKRDLPAEWQPK